MPTTPGFRFDGKNEEAQREARRVAARMVTRVSNETRAAIRAVITLSIRDGVSPYRTAKLIRDIIGLTQRQAEAAYAYYSEMISSGLADERATTLLRRYVTRKIAERAETIARFEIMQALNSGARRAWSQAIDDGLLPEDATKTWMLTHSAKKPPCNTVCAPMEGATVPVHDKFTLPDGREIDVPPGHPRCRCTMRINP